MKSSQNSNSKKNKPVQVVLDMDGVIVDSEAMKRNAVLESFAEFPDKRDAIERFLILETGVPREEKLHRLISTVIEPKNSELMLHEKLMESTERIREAMKDVPLIKGVHEFLQLKEFVFSVNSAAPHEEVITLMGSKQLEKYFISMNGAPSSKSEILLAIRSRREELPIIFLGDTMRDRQAAVDADVPFLGVSSGSNAEHFAAQNIPAIPDFSDIKSVKKLIYSIIGKKVSTRSRVE